MDRRMLDSLFSILLIIGALLGIALCGFAWMVWWLFSHIDFTWR